MTKLRNLEERTLKFSKDIVNLCRKLKKDMISLELIKQCIRSACSVGANYREANEKLSKKDFIHRIRIARKEAKETTYWLELIKEASLEFANEIDLLIKESEELRNILSAILDKTK